MRRPNLVQAIKDHEGTGHTEKINGESRFFPYDDSDNDLRDIVGTEGDLEGDVTVAYGRNLTVTGVREDEAQLMLVNDLNEIEQALRSEFNFWPQLSQPRQNVLIEMTYHMGFGNLLTFDQMIRALQNDDYKQASDEITDSQYGNNFPERSNNLATRMCEGVPYPNAID